MAGLGGKSEVLSIARSMDATSDMILVTGADSSHADTLLQFLASVERHEPGMSVVVYDLGMTRGELRRIGKEYGRYGIRKFDFARYPAHFAMKVKAGEYAWKPAIVWQALCETQGPVCWMDAGNVLTADLSRLRASLSRSGFYSPRSPGTVTDWTHPKMLEFFGLDSRWGEGRANLNGACVAFDPRFERAHILARKWYDGALIKGCIAPEGSDRSNHRQDQALLSVLAYLEGLADIGDHACLGFSIQQDLPPSLRRRAMGAIRRRLARMTMGLRSRRRFRI
jgi:uncharacterized protein DUF1647